MAIAPGLAEVVYFAGGWLFDQVMAGWDVTVLTADHTDPRPLRILGTHAADLETVLARPLRVPCLQAIAVRADLFSTDARVRRLVLDSLDTGPAEVRLFGDRCPAGLADPAVPLPHRLSVAARAFKAQALAAAAAPPCPGEATEVFWRGQTRRPTPVPVP